MMRDTLYKTLKEEDDLFIPSLKNNKWNGVACNVKLMFVKLIELFIIITWINTQQSTSYQGFQLQFLCAQLRGIARDCYQIARNC